MVFLWAFDIGRGLLYGPYLIYGIQLVCIGVQTSFVNIENRKKTAGGPEPHSHSPLWLPARGVSTIQTTGR